jgi:hypothetical protein
MLVSLCYRAITLWIILPLSILEVDKLVEALFIYVMLCCGHSGLLSGSQYMGHGIMQTLSSLKNTSRVLAWKDWGGTSGMTCGHVIQTAGSVL